MKKATMFVSWELRINCPECGSSLDLALHPYDDDGEISTPIFNNKWNDLKGIEVKCAICNSLFEIGGVET